ncbi:MAG: UPF0175 family protein [Prevotellaceae bacterium]|nr:UPF0175 family protein [Prevotellaceae bacterium]
METTIARPRTEIQPNNTSVHYRKRQQPEKNMANITIPLSLQILLAMNMNKQEIENDMRREYGVQLYKKGKLTISQAAELTGMNIYDFMAYLAILSVPVIDYQADELEEEIKQFNI